MNEKLICDIAGLSIDRIKKIKQTNLSIRCIKKRPPILITGSTLKVVGFEKLLFVKYLAGNGLG
jgi:hypothetical protein